LALNLAAARLARRSRPRPPQPLPPTGEFVREHHHLGHRLAPGRLHRNHAAPPVARRDSPASSAARSLSAGLVAALGAA